jgi:hypothetical protein
MNPKDRLYITTFRKETEIVGMIEMLSKSCPRVLANEKPVFSGSQGSPKAHKVMSLCVQWRQLHESRVLSEPREVNSLYVM